MTTKASARETQPLAIVPAIDEYLASPVVAAGAGGLIMDFPGPYIGPPREAALRRRSRCHPLSRLAVPAELQRVTFGTRGSPRRGSESLSEGWSTLTAAERIGRN